MIIYWIQYGAWCIINGLIDLICAYVVINIRLFIRTFVVIYNMVQTYEAEIAKYIEPLT